MPTFKYVAVGPDGDAGQGVGRGAERGRRCATSCCCATSRCKQLKQKKSFNELELTPQRVPKQEIMHFSRQMAAFVRTGIPITDALEVIEEGSGNKRFKQILGEMREQIQNGVPFSDALAEHAKRLPAVLHRHPAVGGAHRPARPSLDQLSGYIERDLEAQEQDQVGADVPARRSLVMSIVTVVILAVYVLPKFTSSSRTSTRSCRCRRACCSGSPTSRRSTGSSGSRCSIAFVGAARSGCTSRSRAGCFATSCSCACR